MMSRPFGLFVGLLLAAGLAGCSRYVQDYHYRPRPIVAEVPSTQPGQPPPVVALASVIGVRREDHNDHLPASVEVRLQLENNGPDTVSFDPQSLDLTSAGLIRFPPPLLRPAEPVVLRPMDASAVSAFFPFPSGHSWDDTDLTSLALRWQLRIGGRSVVQTAHFDQVYRVYYEPYPYCAYGPYPYWGYAPYPCYYPYPWFGGVVIVHHHH